MSGNATPVVEAISGFIGSIFAVTLTHPLDVVKTRLQLPGNKNKGTIDTIRQIYLEDGIPGLYVGMLSEYVKSGIQNACYYYWYSFLKELYSSKLASSAIPSYATPKSRIQIVTANSWKDKKDIDFMWNLAIGCLSGAATQVFVTPLTVVQTRIMTADGASKIKYGMLSTFQNIIKDDGVASLWSGFIPSLILTLNPAIQNLVFDRLKSFWLRYKKSKKKDQDKPVVPVDLSAMEYLLIGAIAKIAATLVTYPYIMAKTRLQWKGGSEAPKYSGTFDVLVKAFQNEGVEGLYSGLRPQILKSVSSTALMFMAKEVIADVAASVYKSVAIGKATAIAALVLIFAMRYWL